MAAKKTIVKRAPKRKVSPKVAPKLSKQRKALAAAVEAVGSQGKLAKKLDCSQQSVSAWLKGETPRPKMQEKMKKVFGIEGPWL